MDNISVEAIIEFTPENKLTAAVIMMLLFALKSMSVVIHSGILFAALGIMFELPVALPLAVLGSAVVATVPYFIGRKLGEGQIEKIEKKYPKLSIVKEMRTSNDFLFVFLVRLTGILPYDIESLYMGAAGLKYKKYLFSSVLGMLQLSVPMTVIGSSVNDPTSPVFITAAVVQISLNIISVVCLFLYVRKIRKRRKEREENENY